MRYLALDIGERRIGVAVSDPEARVASPHSVLDAKALKADISPLLRVIEDYEISEIVVGLPLSMDGTEGRQAGVVRETVADLAHRIGVPVAYHDERLSSSEARRLMADSGLSERDQRGAVDKVAAAIFLQSFLDAKNSNANRTDISDG